MLEKKIKMYFQPKTRFHSRMMRLHARKLSHGSQTTFMNLNYECNLVNENGQENDESFHLASSV